jgi:hypothetical protein
VVVVVVEEGRAKAKRRWQRQQRRALIRREGRDSRGKWERQWKRPKCGDSSRGGNFTNRRPASPSMDDDDERGSRRMVSNYFLFYTRLPSLTRFIPLTVDLIPTTSIQFMTTRTLRNLRSRPAPESTPSFIPVPVTSRRKESSSRSHPTSLERPGT